MNLVDRSIIQQKYDRYVEHYNKSNNLIATYAELLTIKEGLQQRLQELNEKIGLFIDDIEYYLEKICDSTNSSEGKDIEEDLLASNHVRLVENIIEHIKWEVGHFLHISQPNDFVNQNYRQIEKVFNAYGQHGQEQKTRRALESITFYGEEYEQAYYHLSGIKAVTSKIIDRDYPTELKDYRDLQEQEKKEIAEEYRPHHNTREGLVEDLQKVIHDIQTQPRFFHKDGTIKHTTVAGYAVSQKWFADKYGYGERGLHGHIKKISKGMKST